MARTVVYLLTSFLLCSSAVYAEEHSCRTLYQTMQHQAALQSCLPLAEQGDGESSFILSNLYSQGGEGVPADLRQALQWLTRSAEQGYGPACYNLASLHERGDVVPQNLPLAFSWYLKGAELGHLASQLKTGINYLKGAGTEQDLSEARHWLAVAADKGDQSARITLAALLKSSDPEQSMELFRLAAEQGSSYAHYQLALLYREPPDGREMDLDKALYHATESLRLGSEPAVDLVESLRQQMALEESRRIAAQAELTEAVQTVAVPVPQTLTVETTSPAGAAGAVENSVGLHDFDWLLAQPESRYVLQLVQLSSEDSVKTFIQDNQLDGKVNYFRAVTAAGNMYVVLYAESGASLSAARAIAAEQLPQKLSGMVWYRTYRAIRSAYTPVR
ncbi:SPOR domain-containing protein [Amphritea sp.]|uniref:SPOR domain-containing protein n=1 Tax=Amphritea sp. TaxID=1872502 RepID=UPI003D0A2824